MAPDPRDPRAALRGALLAAAAEGLCNALPLAATDRAARRARILARIASTIMPRILSISCTGTAPLALEVANGRILAFGPSGGGDGLEPVTSDRLADVTAALERIAGAEGPVEVRAAPLPGAPTRATGIAAAQLKTDPPEEAGKGGKRIDRLARLLDPSEFQEGAGLGADLAGEDEILIVGGDPDSAPCEFAARISGRWMCGTVPATAVRQLISLWRSAGDGPHEDGD